MHALQDQLEKLGLRDVVSAALSPDPAKQPIPKTELEARRKFRHQRDALRREKDVELMMTMLHAISLCILFSSRRWGAEETTAAAGGENSLEKHSDWTGQRGEGGGGAPAVGAAVLGRLGPRLRAPRRLVRPREPDAGGDRGEA